MVALYRNQDIRAFEAQLFADGICEPMALMDAAGQVVFTQLIVHWPDAHHIAVCCGKGNNGGDGFVVARLAHEQGYQVDMYSTVSAAEYSGEAAEALAQAQRVGIELKRYDANTVFRADVIVDALLGSGLQGEVSEPYTSFISAINASESPVLSVDVPSGLDCDTGQILGVAVQADVTVTFIGLKRGLLTAKAPAYCGELICNSISVPDAQFSQLTPSAKQLSWEQVKPYLPRRHRIAHKGDYGHVLVIGGDYGMGGAVRMAAEAAMRVGAGLVSVATRPEHVPIVSGSRPEIMCHQVADSDDITPLLERATVVVIGPGLGKSDWAESLLSKVLSHDLPKVIDADGLNVLAEYPTQRQDWILTPHPGEAARLLGSSNKAIQDDRFAAAMALEQRYSGVIVLKGAGTIIQSADHLPWLCAAGNPGMATGGMGDILSGIIGGLLAQGLNLEHAAEAGVMVHALAADKAAAQGGERGLLATDLLGFLRELVNPH